MKQKIYGCSTTEIQQNFPIKSYQNSGFTENEIQKLRRGLMFLMKLDLRELKTVVASLYFKLRNNYSTIYLIQHKQINDGKIGINVFFDLLTVDIESRENLQNIFDLLKPTKEVAQNQNLGRKFIEKQVKKYQQEWVKQDFKRSLLSQRSNREF